MAKENPLKWLEEKEDPNLWVKEPFNNFLDKHNLFHAVNRTFWQSWKIINEIAPKFFSFNDVDKEKNKKELSIDWSKYATPEFTFQCHNSDLKKIGIMEIRIAELKKCIEKNNFPIIIEHDPIKEISKNNKFLNKAHSIIYGLTITNYTKIRVEISEISRWSEGYQPIK